MLMTPSATWSTACRDWERRITAGESLVPHLPLFDAEAEKALAVFKLLRIPDTPGTPAFGDVSRPWVFDLVRAIFGSLDPETLRRQIQEYFLLIPKGNAKTTLSAAIMLTAAIVNRRPRAEALLVAPTKQVADRAFGQIVGMIRLEPELEALFHVQDHLRRITSHKTGLTLEVKSADTGVVTGSMATYLLIDELHELARSPSADKVLIELRGSLGKRPDGFVIMITTQSKEQPAGVFAAELKKARAVRDGSIALPLLPLIYELPERLAANDGWRDPATWGLVNPNLGVSIDPEYLRNQMIAKESEGKEALALFASQHFNVEIGIGLRTDTWVGAAHWPACAVPAGLTLDQVVARSEVLTVGIDGGGLDDLLGLSVIGRETGTGRWLIWCHAWAQPEVLERRKDIIPQLRDFEADGDLTICTAPGQSHRELAQLVERLLETGLLPEAEAVGLDHGQVAPILDEFARIGIPQELLCGIPQGIRLRGPIWNMELKLAARAVQHGGARLMNWQMGNAKARAVGSAVVIEKAEAGRGKIDAVIAAFNAAELMGRNPVAGAGLGTPWDRDPNYRMAG